MKPYLKWTAISLGSIVAIAHIGVLGHLVRREPDRIQVPTINIPRGTPYSSYKIEAGKDGYTIEYKANDPAEDPMFCPRRVAQPAASHPT